MLLLRLNQQQLTTLTSLCKSKGQRQLLPTKLLLARTLQKNRRLKLSRSPRPLASQTVFYLQMILTHRSYKNCRRTSASRFLIHYVISWPSIGLLRKLVGQENDKLLPQVPLVEKSKSKKERQTIITLTPTMQTAPVLIKSI